MTERREAPGIRSDLAQAADWLGGERRGEAVAFAGVATDSRTLAAGNLFVALQGPNHDGHDHVADAAAAGAAAAVVSRPVPVDLPQVVVPDTLAALGELARQWRLACDVPVVGITGSNGKTTVKEMTAAILGRLGPTLATRGNLNNLIGVPLTLLRLTPAHRFAVIEMGANHPGEIARLAAIAGPRVGVVTNAGAAHLEGFGSLEGVARAKGELFQALPADGTAVVNADDDFAGLWRELAAGQVLTFGLHGADVSADWEGDAAGSRLHLRTPAGEERVDLAVPGRHNVLNALAAAALTLAAGADLGAVKAGLESVQPVAGRLATRRGRRGARLLDDSYNANPGSLQAGLEVLAACAGRRLLALGDMAELGGDERREHVRAGEAARAAGLDGLFATGELSRLAAEAFGPGGRHFPEVEQLIAALEPELDPEVTLLVKGSRSARMERVVEALAEGGR
ncbi:MAG TPA: UDP-N-acetylmuramoyl-tripeptide--D-alanyl-D-alanine ligase [Gammaproteobacteria bacterium]|nr:UDP-N-acetylmuramoyl-tripeptide--D-alanyl-D-alanine ligase [Gammaproteobacteria bacterium]